MYFTIYGERCSGTNYLEELILENFIIEITWKYGWKHWFGHYDFDNTEANTEANIESSIETNIQLDNTIFIGIIRHPIEWLYSFYKQPHHVPFKNQRISNFLFKKFYSVNTDNSIIPEDLNYITNKKYKNIFKLRKYKNDYLMNTMPVKVKNYLLINYEELRDNPEKILFNIKNTYNLELKHDNFVNINYYKKEKNIQFQHKNSNFPDDLLKIIKNKLDKEQEEKLNYIL